MMTPMMMGQTKMIANLKWTSEELAFLLYLEYKRGIRGREMMERIFIHLDKGMRQHYIDKIMGDTDAKTP